MRSVIASCALAAAVVAASAGARSPIGLRRYGTPGWIVTIREDRLTGTSTCVVRARDGRMIYQPGAIGVRVRDRDTLGAVYRVDDGAAVRWQDRYPALVAAGVEIEGPGLDDPTGRIVWVPEAEVRGARVLTVRTATAGWGRGYRLRALDGMIDATHRLGCTVVARFGD